MDNVSFIKNASLSMEGEPLDETSVIPLDGYSDQNEEAYRVKKRVYGFKLENIQLLLDVNMRSELINDAIVTPLPLMPSFVTGLCNVRGSLVPVDDICQKLNLGKSLSKSDKKKVLVLDENEFMAGIEIQDMMVSMEFDEQDIQKDILSENEKLNQYISYSYQENGSNWFGLDYRKLFQIVG